MRIHREGYSLLQKAALGGLLVNLGVFLALPRFLFYSTLAATSAAYLFLVSFFRYPQRQTPPHPTAVIAPADGTIVAIQPTPEAEYFGDQRIMISIFMSVFNVHANWTPISGRVVYQEYHPGKYLVALHPKSSELNERHTVVIENPSGKPVLVRQIAGLLARRICWYVGKNQIVQAGDELGFIKFGSRVDVFLPLDSKIKVQLYQQVRGSETILAEL
jgi:phosphatidylserine decarboxylase